jgi:hypothetical protein
MLADTNQSTAAAAAQPSDINSHMCFIRPPYFLVVRIGIAMRLLIWIKRGRGRSKLFKASPKGSCRSGQKAVGKREQDFSYTSTGT